MDLDYVSTARYVEFQANDRARALAVLHKGREITYAELARDLRRFTRAVSQFGLRRGAAVAVGCDDIYVHWMLLLGLEAQGAATVSILSSERENILVADFAFLEPHYPAVGAKRRHAVTPEWLERVAALNDEGPAGFRLEAPDEPIRILRTSGTTGRPKQLLLTRRMQEEWIARWIWALAAARGSRYLVTAPFTINAIYTLATAFLRLGNPVVLDDLASAEGLTGAIKAHGITHIIMMPIQLKQILDGLPPGFVKPRALSIISIGAALARPLHLRALERLATEIVDIYGTNEAAGITISYNDTTARFGPVLPMVEVEIVDADHMPLPVGQVGRIRVKSLGAQAAGYLDDPETTARFFKDGWFYPGDLGILHGPRELEVVDRADEILNVGGGKFSPTELENRIVLYAGAGDVGVCGIRNADGVEELHVAVANAGHDDNALLKLVSEALRNRQVGRFYVMRLNRIPRNPNGKIQRDLLRQAILDWRGEAGGRAAN